MSRDGGKFVFYQKRNVQEFIRRNCPLPHELYDGNLQLSEYSKISIQLTGWAKISSFDLKLLLQSLIDHKRSLQI